MKRTFTTALTVAVTAATLFAAPAFASGDGDEHRAIQRANLEEARANAHLNADTFLGRLFTTDTSRADAQGKTTKK